MPIVFNNSTQKVEELSPEAADSGISSGTHAIPMVTKDGEFQAISPKEVQAALNQGYRQPDQKELQSMIDQATYSTPRMKAATALRNFNSTASFGLSDAVMPSLLGISREQYKEEVEKQDAANPGLSFAGKLTGILVPVTPMAQGMNALGKGMTSLATKGIKTLGIAESAFSAKAMQVAAREAAQAALFQTGDEVSKHFTTEPEKSIQQSLADIGLAGVAGAALGVGASAGNKFLLQPLVRATKSSAIVKALTTLKAKAEGVPVLADVDALAARAGVEVSPEIKAALSNDAALKQQAEALASSSSQAGKKFGESVDAFKSNVKDRVLSLLGKTEQNIGEDVVRSEIGSKLQESVSNIISSGKKVVDDLYAPLQPVLGKANLPRNFAAKVSQRIDELGNGIDLFIKPSTGNRAAANQITEELQRVKNFKELKSYITQTSEQLYRENKGGLADVVYKALKETEETAQKEIIDVAAPGFSGQYKQAVSANRAFRQKLESLGDVLNVKRFWDAEDFLERVSDPLKAESVLKSLTSEKRAEVYNILQKDFPELANAVRQAHLDKIKIPVKNGEMDLAGLIKSVGKMTPEAREFVLGPEGMSQLQAVGELYGRIGKSKAASFMDSLLSKIPGGMGSLLGGMSIGGFGGAVAGYAMGVAGKEASDAFRLSMLKYIASGAEASPAGFNAMFNAAKSAYRGASKIERGIASLFKPATPVIEAIAAPSAKSLGLLDKVVAAAQTNPEGMMGVSGDLHEYLPEHSAHLAATSARAVSFLASIRPVTGKVSPLGPERKPSEVEIAKYNRALQIVEQPLMVLNHIKNGSLTSDDLKAISTVYPALYEDMKEKILEKLIDYNQKGIKLDYPVAMSLSLFLGMNLENSTESNHIMANQVIHAPPMPPQAPRGGAPSALKASKLPNIYSTPEQLREQKRSK